jgi:triosephosphate isomerase
MRKIILAGNWKMHKLIKESVELATCVDEKVSSLPIDVLVFPPFTALSSVSEALKDRKVKVGAQNMYFEEEGAFTGEISPNMVKDAGGSYVILGHSERRNIFKEDNALIGKKVVSAIQHGLKAILCVGEKLEERNAGKTEKVIEEEIKTNLSAVSKKDLDNVIIAYEPIWAIGTGVSAKPEQAEEVHKFIRSLIDTLYGEGTGDKMTILYGGSVKPGNIESLAKMPDIDGGLVGGASLKCDDFVKIGETLSAIKTL